MVLLKYVSIISLLFIFNSFIPSISMTSLCTTLPPCECRIFNWNQYIQCTNVSDLTLIGGAIIGVNEDSAWLPLIVIENTSITELGPRAFGTLHAIGLEISGKNLSVIHRDAFSGVNRNLEYLSLEYNQLKAVPSIALNRLYGLSLLSLEGNRIEKIEAGALSNLTSLKSLYLTSNQIKKIHKEALPESLKKLILTTNRLTHVGGIFHRLHNIEWLDLRHNELFDLNADNLRPLINLRVILVDGNQLYTIRRLFYSFRNLTIISLSQNKLYSLNSSFFNLPSLHELNAAFNKITEISADSFLSCQALETLDLSHNQLAKIDDNAFRGSQFIKSLDFSHNKLKKFPSVALSMLIRLKTLDLSYNLIADLNDLSGIFLETLKKLSLASNRLTKITDAFFDHVPALTALNLSFNFLTVLDFNPLNTGDLQRLRLRGNPFICDERIIEVVANLLSRGVKLSSELECKINTESSE